MVFEFEKEKARWQMEYDTLVSQKRELEDLVSNLERRSNMLSKDNERLKANRSSIDGRASLNSGNNGMPKLSLGLGSSLPSPGLPPSKSTNVLKPKSNNLINSLGQGLQNQMLSNYKTNNLGGPSLNVNSSKLLPPQAQSKYQFQM